MGFVDLHSHVLPALDDGSPDMATSMAMIKGLVAVGYDHLTATPHQKEAQFMPTRAAIDGAHTTVRAAMADAGVAAGLSLAAENYWDTTFFTRWQDGSVPRYGSARAFLFEIPTGDLPTRFVDTLFQIQVKGFLPVMAHPERYRPFWSDLPLLERIGGSCPLVVDLGALAGYHGRKVGRVARQLVKERLVHAAASDVHGPTDVRAAAEGIAWIEKKLGRAAVVRLCDENPRRILAGELPEP